MIQTIDAKGNVAAFEYDLMGNLTKVTLHRVDTQDGVDEYEVTLYEYDGRGLVTKVVDALGNVTTTEYDGNGNITLLTDGRGNKMEFVYGPDGERWMSRLYKDNSLVRTIVYADGILRGTADTTLSPKDTTTVEQGILLALRAYQKFMV